MWKIIQGFGRKRNGVKDLFSTSGKFHRGIKRCNLSGRQSSHKWKIAFQRGMFRCHFSARQWSCSHCKNMWLEVKPGRVYPGQSSDWNVMGNTWSQIKYKQTNHLFKMTSIEWNSTDFHLYKRLKHLKKLKGENSPKGK